LHPAGELAEVGAREVDPAIRLQHCREVLTPLGGSEPR
jgi:hypothetical protein